MKTQSKTRPRLNKKTTKLTEERVTVVLLCDNPGYRMKSYGPISLINVGTKKLIDLQIEAINHIFPKSDIIVCLGFDSEKVCKYLKSNYSNRIRVVENQLYSTTNSCESLRLCLNNTNDNKILICDGNLLFNSEVLSILDKNKPCVLVEAEPSDTLEIGLNINKNVAQFFSFGAKHIWSEIIFLAGRDIIESFRRILSGGHNKTRFVFEALNELINMKYEIRTLYNKRALHKINNIKTYHNIKDLIS